MDNQKAPPCRSIVDLDRENLCMVDGVVFEKESFRQYIREEHRPHPKAPIETGVQNAGDELHPSSGISSVHSQTISSVPSSISSFAGSMPNFTGFTSFSAPSSSGSAFSGGGYGMELI
ncbi:MAG: hypothetical protein IKM54_06830 [Butyricicoccus sp.]|nr:hypothetical protein [Butyricicoccus sp.]